MGITRKASTAVCSRYLTTQEVAMNAFFEHHKDSIQFGYRCFDRILLNGLIQPFQQPERVLGFFNTYREGKTGDQADLDGNRRSVSELGEEPLREMGCSDSGTFSGDDDESRRDKLRGAILPGRQTQPGGGHPESTGTSPHPDRRSETKTTIAPIWSTSSAG